MLFVENKFSFLLLQFGMFFMHVFFQCVHLVSGFFWIDLFKFRQRILWRNIVGIVIFHWWVSYPPWLELASPCWIMMMFLEKMNILDGGLQDVVVCTCLHCFIEFLIVWRMIFSCMFFVIVLFGFYKVVNQSIHYHFKISWVDTNNCLGWNWLTCT